MSAPAKPYQARLTTFEGFVIGGLAACTSVTVTNPMEVAKTRLQLDGELQARKPIPVPAATVSSIQSAAARASSPASSGRVYNNAFDAIRKIWLYEGLSGIQRGLGAAYTYQILLNGFRLGLYDPIRIQANRLLGYGDAQQMMPINIASGALSGVLGAMAGNPLFLVKARMQAYSKFNPVGAQYHYTSVPMALKSIVKAEGAKGLARGMDAAMLRTAMGSSVQLPTYNLAKQQLTQNGIMPEKSFWTYLVSSMFSGLCVLILMQPADTALTRMYNQSPNALGPDGKPRGLLYKNPVDCLLKTFRVEGLSGLYKGSLAHLLRIGPHTAITLVANELYGQYYLQSRNKGISIPA